MLGEKRFLRSIQLRNLLSFGPDTPELELKSLNVLIGPNGSGKSNLIDAISLLQAAPRDLMEPIRTGGGIAEWLWKGSPAGHAELIAVADYPVLNQARLSHKLWFDMESQRAQLVHELIRRENDDLVLDRRPDGSVLLAVWADGGPQQRAIARNELVANESILSQRKDPYAYPELTFLGNEYAKIKLFREWSFGRAAAPRRAPQTDLPADFLLEDASNLALVLNVFEYYLSLRAVVLEKLRIADESIANYSFSVLGGTIQLFVHYDGLKSPVPATRLSDGTIRYLCLLVILCHPSPPPLVCLEEPELGLHPDLIVELADLLIEASHRMQLIVTTHSDILVDALTKVPEAVVVCEKENGNTRMNRLNADELSGWLKDYGLGQIWRRGEIGGNRW
jgi:predicted ATPase